MTTVSLVPTKASLAPQLAQLTTLAGGHPETRRSSAEREPALSERSESNGDLARSYIEFKHVPRQIPPRAEKMRRLSD